MDFVVIAVGIFSSKSVTGGDVILSELAKKLVRQGERVVILTSKTGEAAFRGQGLDVEYWIIANDEGTSEASFLRVLSGLPVRMVKATYVLRKKKLVKGTILFTCTDLLYDIFPTLFISGNRVKRIFPFYQIMPNPFNLSVRPPNQKCRVPTLRQALAYLQQRLSLWGHRHACDFVFSLSYLQDFLIKEGITERKIVGFVPGIDWEAANNAVASGKRYDACWMGRYHPMRGCEDLISIWELVCKEKGEAKLAIIGSAGKILEPLIREKHLENNIDILGFVTDEVKFKTIKESKMLIFPSYNESGSTTINDGMACGLPVIAYDLSVYKSMYPRGMLEVPLGNQGVFASEVIKLLKEDGRREQLSVEAKEIASQWSWERVFENFLSGITCVGK